MKKYFILTVICIGTFVFSQNYSYKNEIKLNVTSLFLKNIQLQYEYSITPRTALAIGASVIPKGDLPMKRLIEDAVSEDDDAKNAIKNAQLSYFAFTPEFRWYLGKGFGKGFYVGSFYRYNNFKVDNVHLDYTSDFGTEEHILASGKLNSNTLGLLIGVKFRLSDRLFLDWWILGPHFGFANGNIKGVTDRYLSPFEQAQLKQELEDIDIPFVKEEVQVDSNSATLLLDGNSGGIRAGFCLGFRF